MWKVCCVTPGIEVGAIRGVRRTALSDRRRAVVLLVVLSRKRSSGRSGRRGGQDARGKQRLSSLRDESAARDGATQPRLAADRARRVKRQPIVPLGLAEVRRE